MIKRDFFRLLIKAFGLYSLVTTLFGILPSYISYIPGELNLFLVLIPIVISVLIIGLFILLLFKTDAIINLLKLDKGFDEDRIELKNFNEQNLIKVCVIIIAAFLMVDNIPEFLIQCYKAFEKNIPKTISTNFYSTIEVNYYLLVSSGISILIGYLMISNYKNLAGFLLKRR